VRDIKTFTIIGDSIGETVYRYNFMRSRGFDFVRHGGQLEPAEETNYKLPEISSFYADVSDDSATVWMEQQEVIGCILRCAEIVNSESRNGRDFIVTILVLEKVVPSKAQTHGLE
jgi:hypothetical protein